MSQTPEQFEKSFDNFLHESDLLSLVVQLYECFQIVEPLNGSVHPERPRPTFKQHLDHLIGVKDTDKRAPFRTKTNKVGLKLINSAKLDKFNFLMSQPEKAKRILEIRDACEVAELAATQAELNTRSQQVGKKILELEAKRRKLG